MDLKSYIREASLYALLHSSAYKNYKILCINNGSDVHHIIFDIAWVIEDRELCKLWTTNSNIHVTNWPLETAGLYVGSEGPVIKPVIVVINEEKADS